MFIDFPRTKNIPVSEVSAMLVATTHFRKPSGDRWNILAWRSDGSWEYMGSTESCGALSISASRSASTSHVTSMSSWPGMKIRMSPAHAKIYQGLEIIFVVFRENKINIFYFCRQPTNKLILKCLEIAF